MCEGYDIVYMSEKRCDDLDMVSVNENFQEIGFDILYKNRGALRRFKSGGIIIAVKKVFGLRWKRL